VGVAAVRHAATDAAYLQQFQLGRGEGGQEPPARAATLAPRASVGIGAPERSSQRFKDGERATNVVCTQPSPGEG
jgi:hypothetical protein